MNAATLKIELPRKRGRGKPTQELIYEHRKSLEHFASQMKELQEGLDFHMSTRGWCYYLERHGLSKGGFDYGQKCINEARLEGLLSPGFIEEEEGHQVEKAEFIEETEEEFVEVEYQGLTGARETYLENWRYYDGLDFWQDKDYVLQLYVLQLYVEKVDLKSLFRPIYMAYRIPTANASGWGSYEQRAAFARNFARNEELGRTPVLLAVGDFDPPGLCISDVLRERFEEIREFAGWNPKNLIVDRVGLNYDFIQKNGLTWIDGLETGSGKDMADPQHEFWKRNTYHLREYVKKYGKRKVEANAIIVEPELGRRMLIDTIEKYLGAGALKEFESERDSIRRRILRKLEKRLE